VSCILTTTSRIFNLIPTISSYDIHILNATNFLSKSRGIGNLLQRVGTVLKRFSITPKKFDKLLNRYSIVTRNLGCVPTFPITAVILKRHPRLIKELCQNGVEFAIHGYIHTDYGVLPLREQLLHYEKAINTFNICQVPYTGFRAPFLRTSDETAEAMSRLNFAYDSSFAVHWAVIEKAKFTNASWSEYDRLLEFYQSRKAQDYLVLPRSIDGFIEIPVSIPDDEAMAERLGITDTGEISKIWRDILQKAYERGELFTVQLHPERIKYFEEALIEVLQQAKSFNPPVWIATLREIAGWWKEKRLFTFEIDSQTDNRYRVKTNCSDRATVVIKNCQANISEEKWFGGYRRITAGDFILESPKRPAIGISPDSSPAAASFLRGEGYIVESSDRPDDYGIYFSNLARFDETSEKPLSETIEKSGAPLLRYWRWPDRARSALSVTGDIDSITLADFVLRILENWRQAHR
jgi:peptidoglycan/xylan/chitin deacetylase (PgdA/CDA1 family)